MPKLPVVTGRAAIRALERAGFELVRVRGSHHMLRYAGPPVRKVTVAAHAGQDLPPGTLRAILVEADLSIDAFIALL